MFILDVRQPSVTWAKRQLDDVFVSVCTPFYNKRDNEVLLVNEQVAHDLAFVQKKGKADEDDDLFGSDPGQLRINRTHFGRAMNLYSEGNLPTVTRYKIKWLSSDREGDEKERS